MDTSDDETMTTSSGVSSNPDPRTSSDDISSVPASSTPSSPPPEEPSRCRKSSRLKAKLEQRQSNPGGSSSSGSSGAGEEGDASYNLRLSSLVKRVQVEKRRSTPKQPKGKSRPAPLSKYRRRTANARERMRMQDINEGYEMLRACLPEMDEEAGGTSPGESGGREGGASQGGSQESKKGGKEKLTKFTVLSLALNYIHALRDILGYPPLDTSERRGSVSSGTGASNGGGGHDLAEGSNVSQSTTDGDGSGRPLCLADEEDMKMESYDASSSPPSASGSSSDGVYSCAAVSASPVAGFTTTCNPFSISATTATTTSTAASPLHVGRDISSSPSPLSVNTAATTLTPDPLTYSYTTTTAAATTTTSTISSKDPTLIETSFPTPALHTHLGVTSPLPSDLDMTSMLYSEFDGATSVLDSDLGRVHSDLDVTSVLQHSDLGRVNSALLHPDLDRVTSSSLQHSELDMRAMAVSKHGGVRCHDPLYSASASGMMDFRREARCSPSSSFSSSLSDPSMSPSPPPLSSHPLSPSSYSLPPPSLPLPLPQDCMDLDHSDLLNISLAALDGSFDIVL